MPSSKLTRREALRISLAATTAAGVAAASPAQADAGTGPCTSCAPIPDVPGMLGNPRANELWYQIDEQFNFNPSPAITRAYAEFFQAIGGFLTVWDKWLASRRAGTYPDSYIKLVAPARDALTVLSGAQLAIYDCYYRDHHHALTDAFIEFGEGVLVDPRRSGDALVHTMDHPPGKPPTNYHRWWAILQANVLLNVDSERWRQIGNLVALAWAIQSLAKPALDHPNPPLPRSVVSRQRRYWLSLGLTDLNAAFESFPYPPDISTGRGPHPAPVIGGR